MEPVGKLSLRQAAEWAGTTKPTILKHIKAGKVSAERDEEGRWWFDLAELRRAYGEPETRTGSGNGSESTVLNDSTPPGLRAETPTLVDELRRQVEILTAEKADLWRRLDEARAEAKDTERRLLGVIESQAEQVKLLTDQRPRQPGGLWAWLTRRA